MNKRQTMLDPDDRISKLSDALLTYILSFLPTKYAVKTSVLSTRWRPLWLSVPVLDLRYSDFNFDGLDRVRKSRREADYLTFVYQFLMHTRQYSLIKIHLDGMKYDLSIIASLISLAKQHKVQVLELESYFHVEPLEADNDLPSQEFVMKVDLFLHRLDPMPQNASNFSYSGKFYFRNSIPSSMELLLSVAQEWNVKELNLNAENFEKLREYHQTMFTGNMLVVLKLQKMVLNFPKASICFPKLKVLFLKKILFKNNRSGSNLITTGCPVLEELNIERFSSWDNIQNFTVNSDTLKRLKVRFEPNHCGKRKLKTLIDAPNLRHLDLRDDVTLDYVFGDMSSLGEAELGIWVRYRSKYLDKIVYANNLVTFLRKICNVEHLSLSDHTLLALQKASSCNLLTFYKLTRLKICFCELEIDFVEVSWNLILNLLMSSPNLKHLIWQGTSFDFIRASNLTPEHEVPMCLVWSVETIEIERVWGDREDIKLPQYFLKNCQTLKTLKVEFRHNNAETEAMKQAILALPRASTTCHIEFATKRYNEFDVF